MEAAAGRARPRRAQMAVMGPTAPVPQPAAGVVVGEAGVQGQVREQEMVETAASGATSARLGHGERKQ